MIELANSTHSSNTSLATPKNSELEPKYLEITRLSLSALICCIGIVGNILVVIITAAHRANKTAVHRYILNLAVTDIGVLAICYPLILVKAADPYHWPLGRVVCEVFYPFTDIFYSASIGSIVAIAMDRHNAIVRGMTAYRSISVAKWVILGIWILGFATAVVPLYFVMEFIENKQNGTIDCTPDWPSTMAFRSYVISLSILWYFLPLALILWAYKQIARKIHASKMLHEKIRNMSGSYKRVERKKSDSSNTKALKILVPVVIVFAVTMFPFHAFRLVSLFVEVNEFKFIWVVYNTCTLLLLTNSAINPIIYSLVSKEFRQHFKDVLNFKCMRLCQEPMRRKETASFSYHRSLPLTVSTANADRETDV